MIRIVEEMLDMGIDLLEITETCPNSHNCLWSKRSSLFQIPGALPKGCPRKNCSIVVFRKLLEDSSPAFYAEALMLSRFDSLIKTITDLVVKKNGARRKKPRKLTRRIYDLHIFGQLIVMTIYPLFLETKEIPFLRTAEIENLKNSYHEAEIHRTLKIMRDINPEWLDWVESIMENLLSTRERYSLAAIYLVYLFLKGIDKNQLPDLKNMARDEKERFFLEVEEMIFKKLK